MVDKDELHILVVEDNEDHLRFINNSLQINNGTYKITSASTLRNAIDLLSTISPDLVFAGINLPDGKGTELLSTQNKPLAYPVIFLTSERDEQNAVKAVKAGALDYIVKSESTFNDMPLLVTRVMKEWKLIAERNAATEALKKSESELSLINKIANIFLVTPEDDTYEEVLSVILQSLKSPLGLFSYIDRDGGLACPSLMGEVWEKCRIPGKNARFPHGAWENLIWGRAIRSKQSIIENRNAHVSDGHLAIQRALCTPIVFHGVSIGALTVANRKTDYDKSNRKMLEMIAPAIAPILATRLERDRIKEEIIAAQNAIKESEEMYRTLVENAADGVFIYQDEKFIHVNSAFEKMFNYSFKELSSDDFALERLVHPDHIQIISVYRKAFRNQSHIPSNFQLIGITKNGERLTLEINISRISLIGKPALQGSVRNISQQVREEERRIQLEKKLERAKRMESLGVLTGGVAHDLNNILGPILGYPDLILTNLPKNSPLRSDLEQIKSSAERASDVVSDLLTLARRGKYQMKPLNLNQVIRQFLSGSSFNMISRQNPDVTVHLELVDDLNNISGSSAHLLKVVMNLVNNAFEALPHGGKVTLKTFNMRVEKRLLAFDQIDEGDYVVLEIGDDGIGMTETEIQKIFEPFYSNKKMGRSGSGLGLSVVWGVMKDHNGFIDVNSEEGVGAKFSIYLRVSDEEVQTSDFDEYDLSGDESVLIVDDIAEQRELASRLLSSLGYAVKTAENGHKAVKFLKNSDADVVMLDMIMEDDFDGLDTYESILKIKPEQKVVIASGFSETERVKAALKLGAGKFIRKPYTMMNLGKAVREELNRN